MILHYSEFMKRRSRNSGIDFSLNVSAKISRSYLSSILEKIYHPNEKMS